MSTPFNPATYLANMIAKAPPAPTSIAMVWAYFDETVVHHKEETKEGKPPRYVPSQLLIGGCVSSLDKWNAFERKWRKALEDEKVSTFHSADFYQFKKQFEWYTPKGEKDFARHEAFRDRLADLIIEYVDEALVFTAAVSVGSTEKAVYKRAYNDGALRALHALSREVLKPSGGAHVILARHPDIPPWLLLRYFANFNWDNSLKGCGIFDPREVIQLQAADFVCHTSNRLYHGLTTKSYERLAEGFRRGGKRWRNQIASSWNPPSDWG
jgi:hypothetical protein